MAFAEANADFRSAASGANRSEKDLLGCWPLDDAGGDIAADKSGGHNPGRLRNVVWAGDGDGAAAADFNGINAYISIPHKSFFNADNAFTLEAWIYLNSLTGMRGIVSKGFHHWGSGYSFWQDNGRLVVGMITASGTYEPRSDSVLKEKTWTFVAATYDSEEEKLKMYKDGRWIAETKVVGKIFYKPPHNTAPLTLGGIALFPTAHGQFDGLIRDVRIYGKALAAADVLRDFERSAQIGNLRLQTQKEQFEKTLTCVLKLSVFDKETGKDIKARVYLHDQEKRHYVPAEVFSYGDAKSGWFYHVRERTEVKLPPKRFEITVLHGFEYAPAHAEICFNSDHESRDLRIGLGRLVNFQSRGWYGGEHHIQYIGHATHRYDSTLGWANAARLCEAEGMSYANFVQGLGEEMSSVCSESFMARGNLELCPSLGGHMACVNIRKNPGGRDSLHNMEAIEEAFLQGGLAIYTHPTSGMGDLGNPNCSREMPVAVALGKMPIWDVSYGALRSFDNILVKDWYRYLNLGFKLAAGASTDVYLNNPVSGPPGFNRTYVKMDRLGWEEIVDAYKKGRTFITNGPLLVFQAQGKDPGEIVALNGSRPENVKIHLEAFSLDGVEWIEIVKNGQVLKKVDCNGEKIFARDLTLELAETCWLAARCWGKKGKYFGRLAHASPIYVRFGNDKLKISREDVDYFVHWLEAYKQCIPKYCEQKKENPEFAKGLLKNIATAIEKYRSLLNDAPVWKD
ncbi:MAG: CehA/McbA family metallohydrolase [Verrucomicrobiae bacterium]|nr:CehA/McbA family metallohydrolase [Verrucomicrobiae bacterium]